MRACERILPLPVEVIGKNHEASRRRLPRDSSCGARDDQHFDTREAKKAHRKDNFGGRISLVKVQAASQHRHRDLAPKTQVHFTGVTLDSNPRGREMRDGTVRDDFRAANRPDRLTQPRAENDRDARRPTASRPEIPRRLHRLGIAWLILDFRF